jgi:hypothetical protein
MHVSALVFLDVLEPIDDPTSKFQVRRSSSLPAQISRVLGLRFHLRPSST